MVENWVNSVGSYIQTSRFERIGSSAQQNVETSGVIVSKEIKKIFIMNTNSGWHVFGAQDKMNIKHYISCTYCSQLLYPQYVYVINKLKEAGLLPENYPYLCCNCYKNRLDHERRMIENVKCKRERENLYIL